MSSSELEIIGKNDYEHELPVPTIVGFFSVDGNGEFLPTFEKLRYLRTYDYNKPLKVKLDLNHGYNINSVPKNEQEFYGDKFNLVLKWIDQNNYLDKLLKREVFVCRRGILATIMKTPYIKTDNWIICAEKVEGMILLYPFDPDEESNKILRENTEFKRLVYYGFKFEQYLLSDKPRGEPLISSPVNPTEEFALVYENELNNHKILYVAEIDGINSASPVDLELELKKHKMKPNQFIELKTSFEPSEKNDYKFKRYKSLDWWARLHVAGIENIICGYRTKEGFVSKLQEFQTSNLPGQANGWWNTRACLGFLDDFLTFVRDKLRDEENHTRWIFRRSPHDKFVSANKGRKNDEFDVLPEWFAQKCQIKIDNLTSTKIDHSQQVVFHVSP